jgi:hypothetical protein
MTPCCTGGPIIREALAGFKEKINNCRTNKKLHSSSSIGNVLCREKTPIKNNTSFLTTAWVIVNPVSLNCIGTLKIKIKQGYQKEMKPMKNV